jgi:hypothetical protein
LTEVLGLNASTKNSVQSFIGKEKEGPECDARTEKDTRRFKWSAQQRIRQTEDESDRPDYFENPH